MPDVSGSGKASVKIVGNKVVAFIKAKAKVTEDLPGPAPVVTLLSVKAELKITKKLSDLTPCVNVKATAGLLTVKGKLCAHGPGVCFENGKLYVKFGGKDLKVANIPKVCA